MFSYLTSDKEHSEMAKLVATCLPAVTLFKMGFFGAAHGWGCKKRPPLLKICHTYPTTMKLGTVIPCPKKIQKIYESSDTPLEFC